MLGSGTGVGGRGAAPRNRDGWLQAGYSRPSPPTPTPLPFELFHSAAPKEGRRGRGDGACESPEFHGNRKFSPCERKLWRRICEWSGAHLSCQSPASLSVPPLPSPLLPFLRQRHGHRTCMDRASSSLGAPRGQRSPPGTGAGWAGLGWAAPSLDLLILLHPPLQLHLEKPGGSSGRAALGQRGKASCGESLAAGGCRQYRRCGHEQTAPGACVAPGRFRGLEMRTCPSLPSRPGRPGEERCCRRCCPRLGRHRGHPKDRTASVRTITVRGGGNQQGREGMRTCRPCCSPHGHWRDAGKSAVAWRGCSEPI